VSGEGSTVAVLLSGGADSAALLVQLIGDDLTANALFVNYGQPAVAEERRASRAIARHLKVPWSSATVKTRTAVPTTGEIRGRNAMLLAVAGHTQPTDFVAIGVHGGTGYPDCSRAFADAWQGLLDVQYGGTTRVLVPFADLTKQDVLTLAAKTPYLLKVAYSCERGGGPCGSCRSCKDRQSHTSAHA